MYIEFITFFIVWYLIGCIIYNMKKKYFQRPTHISKDQLNASPVVFFQNDLSLKSASTVIYLLYYMHLQ